jgi:glutamine amidotransferase
MNKPSVGVLNLINSNAAAVHSVIQNLGYSVTLTTNLEEIESKTHLVIPGVGSFAAVVDEVRSIPNLRKSLIAFSGSKKPILGICLGMHLLGRSSEESLGAEGLGILDYRVQSLETLKSGLPIPHVGWNQVKLTQHNPLFEDIPSETDFYFSHSYAVMQSSSEIGVSEYGGVFFSSVATENVYGVQFHPERSQHYGKQIIKNFLSR